MIRIGIVDDEEPIRNMIYKSIAKADTADGKTEFFSFSSGEKFVDRLKAGETFDILFTDIQMDGMNGMELGKEVRKYQPEMFIVFITSHAEYAAESYLIEAYQYILKQDLEYRLPIVAHQLIEKLERQSRQYRMVGTNSEKTKIYYRDIIYIYKSKGAKYVNYITMNGEYRERISLECIYKELKSREFILAGRGYIVNMKRIYRLSGDTIYLEKDCQVQISGTKLKEVKKEINRYWREL